MFKITLTDEIDSTSKYAKRRLSELEDFDVISADYQTDGHGQFERKWFSSRENGGNCYISLVLKPENISHLNELTQFTSLMVLKTLEGYGLVPQIKYPNDVLIDGKKISGVLAESVFIGNVFKGVVVGIGVNLNMDSNEIKNIDVPVTSVFLEKGENIDKNLFIGRLLANFANAYGEFLEHGICIRKN